MGAAPEPTGSPPAVPIDAGRGPVVLLVHGQPGRGLSWAPVADLLSPSFRVVAPDRPGWGNHPRPATSLAGNAAALARMLAARDLADATSPAVVVGHSLGGGIAIELALSYPELVSVLVLVSSVGVGAALGNLDRLLALPVLGEQLLRAGALGLERAVGNVGRLAGSSLGERVLERANRHPAVRSALAEGGRALLGRDRRSFLVEQRSLVEQTPALESRLHLVAHPTVVIHGTADHVVPAQAARQLAAAIPGAELVMRPGLGHLLPFEEPEVVAGAVRRYWRLVTAAPPPRGVPGA
ncbi:MAG TPA: alpha/beta hydrolase [Acidimicrobiales bacterium]|nr:alpha/beta hydrolase [Acidimicrobiales bacterium]